MNAIQESIAPVGQTCVYNRADGFGYVTPTRECGHNRAKAQHGVSDAKQDFHFFDGWCCCGRGRGGFGERGIR
jgi:hypothetical protein